MDKIVAKITIILYLLLAAFPLMKENINSIFIILCCLFAINDFIKNKKKIVFSYRLIILTLVFWIFLLHEIVTLDFNSNTILLHLPFLIFPLLFIFKPDYINYKVKNNAVLVFQGSVIVQTLIYLFVFLDAYSLEQVFAINNYNIPLFRTYVLENAFVAIHPTYFSAFLLCSFTASLFLGLKKSSKKKFTFHIINCVFTSFFILVFISKIVVISLFFTIILYLTIKLKNNKKIVKTLLFVLILGLFTSFGFKNLIIERFNEIKTEINRPLVGNYHNSINIRVAIIKCSYKLLKELPELGYGQSLQKKLNNCYKENYNSNFYKISTYNTHNYLFNLILYGGWVFFIVFTIYLYYLLFKVKYPLFIIVFIIQILIINLTENFLSRHYGIILFIYFISLFLSSKKIHRN